jgi:hypothetical protein
MNPENYAQCIYCAKTRHNSHHRTTGKFGEPAAQGLSEKRGSCIVDPSYMALIQEDK